MPGWTPRTRSPPKALGRKPLPIGTWGLIRTYPVGEDAQGKPIRVRAVANYRDFDGITRRVEASGRTATAATQNLRTTLQNRASVGRQGELTAMSRFSAAADLWLAKVDDMVRDGRRSPGTVETYRRQLKNHVLPAMGEVRLGEATTPLVDRVIASIKGEGQRVDRQELPVGHLRCHGRGRPVRRDHGQPGARGGADRGDTEA